MFYPEREKRSAGDVINVNSTMTPQEYLNKTHRVVFLYGPIQEFPYRADSFNTSFLMDSMISMAYENPKDPIIMIIDSPGGVIDTGLVLYDTMKSLPCPVYTVGRVCYSMAAFILAAGEKGHRYIYPHARAMLHLPRSSFGQSDMDSEDLNIRNTQSQNIKKIMIDLLVENGVKRTAKEIIKDIDREKWIVSNEIIDYGLADRVLSTGDPFHAVLDKKEED